MKAIIRTSLALAGLALATHAAAQVSFYEHQNYEGRSFTTQVQIGDFERYDFDDRASSVVVKNERWEVCEAPSFNGRCVILRPGRYPSLAEMGLNDRISSVRAVDRNARIDDHRHTPAPVAAQITFYQNQGFRGRTFVTDKPVNNFALHSFNDLASSVVVVGDRWEACEKTRFRGRCVVLRPGQYPSLAEMGLNDRISSVRAVNLNARVDDRRYAPMPVAAHDYRRRDNERLYEANVTSVRAVLGTPEQRCWVETEEIAQERQPVNIPAALAGAVIGGILGHQVGSGTGQDIATAGGAVGGAAIGAYIGRDSNGNPIQTRDVQRCETASSQARPDFWDVTYTFRGQAYRMQTTTPPGRTITVNEQGEPRA